MAGETGPQQAFQLGLVEHAGLREPVDPGGLGTSELGQYPRVGIEQPQALRGPGDGRELRADTHPRQDPVDLVVEVHGPRPGEHVRVAIEDQAVHTLLSQQGGCGDSGRTGPDHDDGDPLGHDSTPATLTMS